jgi:hypothetical protein
MNQVKQASGLLVVPILRYNLGIINWSQAETQKLDRKTREMLTIHRHRHTRANIHQFCVPGKMKEEA